MKGQPITQENDVNGHEHKVVGILACPGIPRSAGTRRYAPAEPAARGPGGGTRRHLVRDETGTLREPHRVHRLDHPDHPRRVPLHHRQPGGLRRPDRRRPGGGAAPLRGDRRRRQGAGNRNRRGPGRGQVRRHRALGQPGGPAPGRSAGLPGTGRLTMLSRKPEMSTYLAGGSSGFPGGWSTGTG